jgi:hypothetical protein
MSDRTGYYVISDALGDQALADHSVNVNAMRWLRLRLSKYLFRFDRLANISAYWVALISSPSGLWSRSGVTFITPQPKVQSLSGMGGSIISVHRSRQMCLFFTIRHEF